MRKLLISLLIPGTVLAQQCVLQDRTVSQSTITIAERSEIIPEVVPAYGGGRKCMVAFRARIGAEWHTAFGEYEWDGSRPREEACAVAVKRAEDSVRERVGKTQVMSEKTLICNDNPDLQTLKQLNPGTVGELSQFRPHPEYPREFWYNGAQCRLILDSQYTGKDIKTFQGVICRVDRSKWVVVDKF